MENVKKIILLFILSFTFISCVQENFKKISSQLYKDSSGELYIKAKNKSLLHPSKDISKIKGFIYLNSIYDVINQNNKNLKNIVDIKTFEKVNRSGNYFKDTNQIYVYTNQPKSNQLFNIKNKEVILFGMDKDYLRIRNVTYYKGIK